jgi:hypothetical protein
MGNVGMFYGHLEYYTAICIHIIWQNGIFCGHLVCSFRFGTSHQEKCGNPG